MVTRRLPQLQASLAQATTLQTEGGWPLPLFIVGLSPGSPAALHWLWALAVGLCLAQTKHNSIHGAGEEAHLPQICCHLNNLGFYKQEGRTTHTVPHCLCDNWRESPALSLSVPSLTGLYAKWGHITGREWEKTVSKNSLLEDSNYYNKP